MAASGVRLTLDFNLTQGQKEGGWSESWDTIYGNLSDAQVAKTAIANFILARLYCLGTGVELVGAKLTADPGGAIVPPRPRRATQLLPVPAYNPAQAAAFAYNKALVTYPADYATNVLYYDLRTASNVTPSYRKSYWMAGIPDASDDTRSIQPVAGAWINYFETFRQAMQANGPSNPPTPSILTIRSIDKSNNNPFKRCSGYNATNKQFTVVGHGFADGQLINAEGFTGVPGGNVPKGTYKCIRIDADTIALARAQVTTAIIPPGGFRALVYVWNPVATATQIGFSKRNKGRPFNLLVGKRRVSKTAKS